MAESRGYRPTLRPDANRNPDDHVTGGLLMVASISLDGSDDFSRDSGHLTRSTRLMQARHPSFYFEDGNCIFLVRSIVKNVHIDNHFQRLNPSCSTFIGSCSQHTVLYFAPSLNSPHLTRTHATVENDFTNKVSERYQKALTTIIQSSSMASKWPISNPS
jgi:hypothetical protein